MIFQPALSTGWLVHVSGWGSERSHWSHSQGGCSKAWPGPSPGPGLSPHPADHPASPERGGGLAAFHTSLHILGVRGKLRQCWGPGQACVCAWGQYVFDGCCDPAWLSSGGSAGTGLGGDCRMAMKHKELLGGCGKKETSLHVTCGGWSVILKAGARAVLAVCHTSVLHDLDHMLLDPLSLLHLMLLPWPKQRTAKELLWVPAPAKYMPQNIIITLLFLCNRIFRGSCWATCLLKAFALLISVPPSITRYLRSRGGCEVINSSEFIRRTVFLPVDHAAAVSTLRLVPNCFPVRNLVRILPLVSTRFFTLGDRVCSDRTETRIWHKRERQGSNKAASRVCVTSLALHLGLRLSFKTTLIPFFSVNVYSWFWNDLRNKIHVFLHRKDSTAEGKQKGLVLGSLLAVGTGPICEVRDGIVLTSKYSSKNVSEESGFAVDSTSFG